MAVATSSFTPNGLLGGISGGLFSSNNDASTSSQPTSGASFVPNGLLSVANASNDGNEWDAFDEIESACNEVMPTADQLDEMLDTPAQSHSVFEPTGLFGGISETSPIPPVDELPSPLPSFVSSSIRAKTFSGRSVFIRKKHISTFKSKHILPGLNTRMGNLLDTPVHRMLDQISVEAAQAINDRERLGSHRRAGAEVENKLWVDRYRPSRFTELVGNERVARDIMTWIKEWDFCVFGTRSIKGKKRVREEEDNEIEDEFRRPKEKILLLSGPPGLGKTTMAHVLAQHAGYEVMEINASDARTGQIVDDRIRPALESGSAVGSTKPVLLVIDEIDGATGAGENSSSFIYKLVQLTYARPKKSRNNKDQKSKRPILRPIICICNDINASSLAKLRPHALQIRLQRPADIHTVKRLKEVCEAEGLRADSRALSALVGIAKGDMRGCLNTLQFVKARNEDVNEHVIRRATTGMKEGDTSIIAVLGDIFSPLSKKRVKEAGMTEEEESRYVGRLSRLIDSCGRDSSIAIACFSHYAHLRQHDADFSRYHKANEWLMTFDTFSAAMYSEGEFALNQYLPYMLVPFYHLFQERGGPRIERDQTDWEVLQTTRANEEIYKSLGRCLQTASTKRGGDFRHLVCTPIMQLEFAPYINRIISPPLRPVNSQIIKPEERAVLQRLVSIMAALDLRFVPERAEDGQLTYRLDPAVDVFITYDGKRASDINLSRYAVRKIVAQEIDAEITARTTDFVDKGTRGKHADMFGQSKTKVFEQMGSPNKTSTQDGGGEPSSKRRKTAEVDIADRPPVDFFGRPITIKTSTNRNGRVMAKSVEKKFKISYKYAEGNSAAVRKPIKLEAFL